MRYRGAHPVSAKNISVALATFDARLTEAALAHGAEATKLG
jgi:hypothetical protein